MKHKKLKSKSREQSPLSIEVVQFQKESLRKLSIMMAVFCAVLGSALYVNTLGHNYTIDDDSVIAKNKIVTKGVSATAEIFTTPYRAGFWNRPEALYRPLPLTMFAIEWQLAPDKPFVGHLINILIYALTGFTLFITLKRILSKYTIFIPFVATLLFMAHPLHTEVVANIKSRDELLCFLFLILSLYFLFGFCRYEKRKVLNITLSLFCFFLALLSKESALTFLALFPLALYYFTELDLKKNFQYTSLFLIPLAVYFALRAHALVSITQPAEILAINNSLVEAADVSSRLATAIKIIGKYIGLLIIPHPLVYDYSFNEIKNVSIADPGAIVSVLLLASLLLYSLRMFRKKNIFSFCIIYFFISISLVSNIFFLIESVMAERFLYTASLAYCMAVPILFFKLFRKDIKAVNIFNQKTFFTASNPISIVIIFMLFVYSAKTMNRNLDWKSNLILLSHDVKNSPNSARIRNALGSELLLKYAIKEKDPIVKAGFLDESIVQLQKGLEILPVNADAFYNLGIAYNEKGDGQNAVKNFEAAKRSKIWDEAEFFDASGLASGHAGQYDNAFADFSKAVSINDSMKEAYCNWGNYLTEAGREEDALKKLIEAIKLDSNYVSAWYNTGNAFAHKGDYEKAISVYQKVLVLDSAYIDAMMNIGNCYAAMRNFPKSIEWYEKIIGIDPYNIKANQNRALSKKMLGI